MMLDEGFEYIQAIQDALKAGRKVNVIFGNVSGTFQLVHKLLSKSSDDVVRKTNSSKQNLFHCLSKAKGNTVVTR